MDRIVLLSGITLAAMASPGPDMFLIMRHSLKQGRSAGIATVLGICAGLSIHLTLALMGLSWLITQNIYIYSALKYLGAAYLAYLGFQALRSKGPADVNSENSEGGKSNGFIDGFFTNLLNPKVTIFVFAIFTQFVFLSDPLSMRLVFGVTILLTSFLGWSSFVFLLQGNTVRQYIKRFGQILDRIFGGIMLAIAFRVAFTRD